MKAMVSLILAVSLVTGLTACNDKEIEQQKIVKKAEELKKV